METVPDGSVVVGVDGSDQALVAVRWAAAEARRRRLPLAVVTAVSAPVVTPVDGIPLSREYRLQALAETARRRVAAASAVVDPDVETTTLVRLGRPAAVLRDAATRAALLVVGNRGHGGFAGLLIGSVGVSVAAHADCPVVVVPAESDPLGPVVVGVGAAPCDAVLGFAFEQAASRGRPLVAVHAWNDAGLDPFLVPYVDWSAVIAEEEAGLQAALDPWVGKFPEVDVRTVVAHDGAARTLVLEAEGAALVVVGSRGRGVVRGPLLGSVSQTVLHHASCPVALVRPGR